MWISENFGDFLGVDVIVDWECNYVNGNLFCFILGNIMSSEEGLLKENLDFYLVCGYNCNDCVGKSYIE